MTRTMPLLTLVAAAALAGCDSNNGQTIVVGPDGAPVEEAPVATEPVQLPPSIAASKTYRCRDGSIVGIDWLSDNKSANLRAGEDSPTVHLTAPEEGQALTAEGGYSLSGSAQASSITLEQPGKGSQTCKA